MTIGMKDVAKQSDARIAELVLGALLLYPFVDPEGMEIHVDRGVVTVSGHNLDEDQVRRAMSLIKDFICVREVRDGTRFAATGSGLLA